MARKNDIWFEFAGAKSDVKGLKLLALPDRARAELRVPAAPTVPGRDGGLWLAEDAYDDFEIKVKAQLLAGTAPGVISAWLTGRGWLRFSDAPTRAYKARALAAYTYAHIGGCAARQVIEVSFLCHPCAYVYPVTSTLLVNGSPLINPGTRYAEPKIVMTVSGDVALTIGGQTLVVSGYSGPITIDMEARVAYNGTTNLNPRISGDWPLLIAPGANPVSWTGSITNPQLQGNWRDI